MPSAHEAAIESIGYSSIMLGTLFDGTVIPLSLLYSAIIEAVSSPPLFFLLKMLIFAPISFRVSNKPFLPLLIIMFLSSILLSGQITAATTKKAAEEGSQGTFILLLLKTGLPPNSTL